MGSLMAGWDSPVRDPNSVKLMRNKSLTKEGIEEYWKLKKKTEEEHLKAVSPSPDNFEVIRSSSLPKVNTRDGHLMLGKESNIDLEKLMNNCWWTRSNWAFLNEPPVIAAEVPTYKYAAQHHVGNMASPKPDTSIPGV